MERKRKEKEEKVSFGDTWNVLHRVILFAIQWISIAEISCVIQQANIVDKDALLKAS